MESLLFQKKQSSKNEQRILYTYLLFLKPSFQDSLYPDRYQNKDQKLCLLLLTMPVLYFLIRKCGRSTSSINIQATINLPDLKTKLWIQTLSVSQKVRNDAWIFWHKERSWWLDTVILLKKMFDQSSQILDFQMVVIIFHHKKNIFIYLFKFSYLKLHFE